jgi:hypothetical protein
MAGHLRIDENYVGETDSQTKAIRKIVSVVYAEVAKSYTGLRGSLKWRELPAEFLEAGDSAVFFKLQSVPRSMVYGGKGDIEVHLNAEKKINAIYLVA